MPAERSRDLEVRIAIDGPVDPLIEADGTKRVALWDGMLIFAGVFDYLADFDGNCTVGATDLLALLVNWGPCP